MTREPAPAPAGAPEAAGADGGAGVDARLVRESRSGNRSARRALIDRHQDAVYNLALRMLGAPDAAADVAGETFVKAFRRLSAFPSNQRLTPWLLRIAHNTAIESLRRGDRREGPAPPVPHPTPPAADPGRDGFGSAAAAEPLAGAFEGLPMRYRAAIVLRYQAGLSFAEVGDVMGVPEQTARARVEGARRALAERLRERPEA